uniref:Single-pass membrane protein with coiled-coil domains 2 n=1 Tax=Sus scrofa TaxID=9823 RepID=A0A4X1SW02_PIG
ALTKLTDKMPVQMKTIGKEQELMEKNNSFLQNTDAAEGTMQNLLREFTKMDRILDRSDDEDIFSENPPTDFLHDDMLELEAESDHNPQSEPDEQEKDHIPHEDPQASTSLQFSEKNIPQLLLSEVMSLEGQIENLGSHQDLDPEEGVNMEADACNEAHELKEKLIARIENFCKGMTLLNTKLGIYQMQGEKTDSQSPEEMGSEEREPLLPQAPIALVQNSPPRITMWKRALKIFILLYVVIFTGLSCYILLFDATFIFERILPTILGRRRMWELREIIAPFLNLEVEDLLPS